MFSKLSASDTALFVCDIQGCFLNTIFGIDEVIQTASFLLHGARILQLPCIITEQYPEKLQHTVKELEPYIQQAENQEGYPVFSKVDFTMCTEEVKNYMKVKLPNVKKILLCGMETHVCVYQSCLDLMSMGYNVYVCVDGVSSRSSVDRKVALSQLQQMGIQLITSENAMFQFIGSKNHPQFRTISALVKSKSLPSLLDF